MVVTVDTYLTVEWCLISLCLGVILLRLTVRSRKQMFSFWLSEIFLILAFLSFLTLVVGDTYSFSKNNAGFSSYNDPSFFEWLYAGDIVFDIGFYFPRFSMLAFYNELFPISETALRKALAWITAYTVVCFLLAGFLDMFWCGADITVNWAPHTTCSLLDAINTLYINWTLGLVSELLIFALPFGMLGRLKRTPRREKIALISVLAIGAISVLASIIRFTISSLALSSFTSYLIGSTEIATQILVVALPALRPLLPAISTTCKRFPSYLSSRRRGSYGSTAELGGAPFGTGPGSRGTDCTEGYDSCDMPSLPDINDLPELHLAREK